MSESTSPMSLPASRASSNTDEKTPAVATPVPEEQDELDITLKTSALPKPTQQIEEARALPVTPLPPGISDELASPETAPESEPAPASELAQAQTRAELLSPSELSPSTEESAPAKSGGEEDNSQTALFTIDDEHSTLESALEAPEQLEKDEAEEAPARVPEISEAPIAPVVSAPLLAPIYDKVESARATTSKQKHSIRRLALFLSAGLLFFVASSGALLFHDLTSSYIYDYALDPTTGTILEQQSLGEPQAAIWLSDPVFQQGQIEIGIQQGKNTQGYQLFRLQEQMETLNRTNTQYIEQAQPALNVSAASTLISSGQQGLRVYQQDGHLLWQSPADRATSGAHRFAPISDQHTLYSIKSSSRHEVAAYNLADGSERWSRQLDDTLTYTPPFLLNQGTVYIAGDHTLYALDSQSGQVLWQKTTVARTLLLAQNANKATVLAAGAEGISAFQPLTGELLWTFQDKNDETRTTPQFYQAALSTQAGTRGPVLYTSGIRWYLPHLEQQAWLYAIDATTGKRLWSQQLDAGLMSGDSSRIFTPLVDQRQQAVFIQHQEQAGAEQISAYNMATGAIRWHTTINGVRQSAPSLLQAPGGTLFLFAFTNNGITALSTLPADHYFILLASLLSIVGLLIFWLPRLPRRERTDSRTADTTPYSPPAQAASTKSSGKAPISTYILLGALLVIFLLGTTIFGFQQLNTDKPGIYQLDSASGKVQWKQTDATQQLVGIDSIGSISKQQNQEQQWLQVTGPNGSTWQTFASVGTLSLATNTGREDRLFVLITGNSQHQAYQLAPNDSAYPDALRGLFMLASFSRANGQFAWQKTVLSPQAQQQGNIVGADTRYLYVSSHPYATTSTQTTQLLAINQQTGNVDWRIFGPEQNGASATQSEKLFIQQHQLIWQAGQRLYLLGADSGQIEWTRTLSLAATSVHPEQDQEVATITSSGQVIVATSEQLYALDQSTGTLLWTRATSASTTGLHLVAAHDSIVLSQGRQLQAYAAKTGALLWSQLLQNTPQSIVGGTDGQMIYLSLQSGAGNRVPSILALTTTQGRTYWSTSLPEQSNLATILLTRNRHILVSLCEASTGQPCVHKRLYSLDVARGTIQWKSEGKSINALWITPDGNRLAFQSS